MNPSTSDLAALVRLAVAETLLQLPKSERLAYTIDQAADAIGVPRNTLRDRVSTGEIPAKKRCGKWLILREDLLRWLRDCN